MSRKKDKEKKEFSSDKSQKEYVSDVNTETKTNEGISGDGQPADKKSEVDDKSRMITAEAINELNDKYLRLYSEFDNYRKRTAKERLELNKTATQDVIADLLPILDDFARAIKINEEIQDCEAIKEGMNLIYNKLSGILTKKGLKPIEVIGETFNTDFHEAITYIAVSDDKMKGKIVDEIEKGYLLNDKVIRYAKVVIGQ